MRKLFIFISALMLAVTASATVISITPTSPHSSNNLRQVLASAASGDIIEMAAGTYVETGDWLAINDKEVTVRAAKDAEVIIKPQYSVRIIAPNAPAKAEFIDVKFDCSALESNELFVPSDDKANQSVILDNCEFYDWSKNSALIHSTSERRLDVININNCYFHGFEKSIVFVQNANLVSLSITNSTFTNVTASVTDSYWAAPIYVRATSGSVLIDHCTFYDVNSMSTSYGTITIESITDPVVSNCIFMLATTADKCATNLQAGGDVKNCLTYNYDNWQPYGHYNTATLTNCIKADPRFNDLANNKYTYDGDWATPSISPARGAATDGSDLGAPMWYSDETLPSTDFSSSYDFLGTKALLTGKIGLNGSNHIAYNHNSEIADGTAKWKLHVSRACYISVVADREAGNSVGCQLTLTLKDADGNIVGLPLNAAASYNDNDISFPGTIFFSEEGDYTLILTNSTLNSTAVLEKITLSYYGGAVQDISSSANTTLNVADALFEGCTRDEDGITYPSSGTASAWIKWNIATSETKYYDLTVNVNTEYNHGFTAAIYEDEEAEPVASVTEGSYVSTQGVLALELGRVNLVGGKNYIVKVTNAPSGSQAKVTSVVFAPVVATATELPGTLAFSNAVLSEKANITDGMLYFNEPGADKDPRGQWAQWEVTTDHNGLFLFTMGVTSENGQSYKITIKDDSENVIDFYEASPETGNQTLKHYFALASGTYFVKVENTRSYSKGHLVSFAVTEPAGVVSVDESATTNDSWLDKIVAKEAEGPLYDVQIIRTIKAGMYNTFCLPFAVDHDQCKDIFGSDVQIRTLDEATVETGDFVLNLNFKNASDIYPGTPVLIQTSRDIVNPVFTGVKFTIAAPSATTKTNANFVGTFVKTELEANENLLFLGANNKLYFPTASIDMYGMRAYFLIQDAHAGAIKRARIVENEQIATDIELVNSPDPTAKSQKLMENGQLIIIRDGVRYNVMGARVK